MKRPSRHSRLRLMLATVLALAVTAAGRDPVEGFLRQGRKLLDRGLFADAAAAFTRALEQNPKSAQAYYYRALAKEMVDRQAAIHDWKKFVELVAADPDSKGTVTQVQDRVQALQNVPALPETLRASCYVAKAGDYYQEVAAVSLGLQWSEFPVGVFAENPPEAWRRPLAEALGAWKSVFPLQTVNTRQEADILISWGRLPKGFAGDERDALAVEKEGESVTKRRKTSFITLDNTRRLSEPEMRVTIMHELGHALGIKGHSDGSRDVMFPEEQEIIVVSGGTQPGGQRASPEVTIRTHINTKLTLRDVNTLIRLYNCPGPWVALK